MRVASLPFGRIAPVAAREIEYVEIYVADKEAVAEYFVSSLGFTQVASAAGAGGGRSASN